MKYLLMISIFLVSSCSIITNPQIKQLKIFCQGDGFIAPDRKSPTPPTPAKMPKELYIFAKDNFKTRKDVRRCLALYYMRYYELKHNYNDASYAGCDKYIGIGLIYECEQKELVEGSSSMYAVVQYFAGNKNYYGLSVKDFSFLTLKFKHLN